MSAQPRISVWILGDQLLLRHPALLAAEEQTDRAQISILLVESEARKRRLPYQRKKLVLLISAMRHYADQLRGQGYVVDYVRTTDTITGLRRHLADYQPAHLITMAAAEYSGRRFQEEELSGRLGLPVTVLPNTQFLLGQFNPMTAPNSRSSTRAPIMERFYRLMRRHFNVLLDDDGAPLGGKWNFDRQNRKALPKAGLDVPTPITFKPDPTTLAVMDEVAASERGFGTVDGFSLAVTHAQAQAAADDFFAERLVNFGAYEDAMSADEGLLYHSMLAAYLNIGLLEPMDLIRRAEDAYRSGEAPINSVEGFIRQILGWREYIYLHYWLQMPDLLSANGWDHNRTLPQMFWHGETEMNCLHTVIGRVIQEGYSHHIERLMVLCNFCMLAGIDPADVNRWFLCAYIDAYEWVVAPNVIGMGLNADGGKTATKPYIASANYINRMGDYCANCRFDPKQRVGEDACPFNYLYWHFLLKHEARLRANPRLGPAVLGLRNLNETDRQAVQSQAERFLSEID